MQLLFSYKVSLSITFLSPMKRNSLWLPNTFAATDAALNLELSPTADKFLPDSNFIQELTSFCLQPSAPMKRENFFSEFMPNNQRLWNAFKNDGRKNFHLVSLSYTTEWCFVCLFLFKMNQIQWKLIKKYLFPYFLKQIPIDI